MQNAWWPIQGVCPWRNWRPVSSRDVARYVIMDSVNHILVSVNRSQISVSIIMCTFELLCVRVVLHLSPCIIAIVSWISCAVRVVLQQAFGCLGSPVDVCRSTIHHRRGQHSPRVTIRCRQLYSCWSKLRQLCLVRDALTLWCAWHHRFPRWFTSAECQHLWSWLSVHWWLHFALHRV